MSLLRAALFWLSVPIRYLVLISIPPRHRHGPGRLARLHAACAFTGED